jgi:hypothetical protein
MRPDEYRRLAEECTAIAATATNTRQRLMLLQMAHSWLRLAEQAERNLKSDLAYEARSPSEQTRK